MSEFSRRIDLRRLPAGIEVITASEAECNALARRFGLVRVDSLSARITLERSGETVLARGALVADIVQSCAVSAEDLPVHLDEAVQLRFVPPQAAGQPDEEIELAEDELDEIEMDAAGGFDLGEALAQTLALAIDPFAVGPGADEARSRAGLIDLESTGPFAALSALKKPGN